MFRLFREDIRASDGDREETVELLKRHYAAGRLSSTELSARVDDAYAAVGLLELEALTRDLPHLAPPPTRERPAFPGRLAGALIGVLVAVIGVLAIASAIPAELWAMLLFFGLPIVMMGLFVLLPVALPVLAMAWLARSLGAAEGRPRQLGRGSGWVGSWSFDDSEARPRPVGRGRRRGRLFDL
ncbi:MAG: DUF1707 domain-containing protein [Actinomycetota bacterium]|nr:DUF1707 domain-containing protein [Actinomycetota bacterium]